jgi:hypothetical protein
MLMCQTSCIGCPFNFNLGRHLLENAQTFKARTKHNLSFRTLEHAKIGGIELVAKWVGVFFGALNMGVHKVLTVPAIALNRNKCPDRI